MSSLCRIQRFSKIGKVFSEIAFFSSMVGLLGCIVGLMSISVGSGSTLRIGNLVLNSMVDMSQEFDVNAMNVSLITWLVICAGGAVLAWFAKGYFSNELLEGTPFSKNGASELRRLGILLLVIPVITSFLAETVQLLVAGILQVPEYTFIDIWDGTDSSIMLGIAFLALSLICRYGAEEMEKVGNRRSDDFMNMV